MADGMVGEVRRRFDDVARRRNEVCARAEQLKSEQQREWQHLGQAESSRGGSQWQLNEQSKRISEGKALLAVKDAELMQLIADCKRLNGILLQFSEYFKLWDNVKNIRAQLTQARANLPSISLEEAKAAAEAAANEVKRLQDEQLRVSQLSVVSAARLEDLKRGQERDELAAAKLAVEDALTRGNRGAFIAASDNLKRLLTKPPPRQPIVSGRGAAEGAARHPRRAAASARGGHFAPSEVYPSYVTGLGGGGGGGNSVADTDLSNAKRFYYALQARVNQIILVKSLEAKLEESLREANRVSEQAILADNEIGGGGGGGGGTGGGGASGGKRRNKKTRKQIKRKKGLKAV